MVKIIFDKMHGCGNDFVIIDQRTSYTNIEPRHIKKLANRRTGIGFDQLILINGSSVADCGIEIYNQDGSLAMACGNATRCVAWLTNATTIETASGILSSEVKKNGPVKISMGNPVIHDHEILLEGLELITKPVSISMGNPHLILIVKDINNMDLVEIAKQVYAMPIFIEGVNISLAQVIDEHNMSIRVFERGVGLSLSCGSAACASFVAAATHQLVQDHAIIKQEGGKSEISWQKGEEVFLEGPISYVFKGEVII